MMNLKFRPGFAALLCGIFVLGTASLGFAEEEKTEMTKADSISMGNRHLGWGDRYLKNGQYEDAETQLLKSWGYNPTRATTARRLGKLYNQLEKYEDAITWYRKAIDLEPKSKYTKGVYLALASIYVIQEQPEKAIGSYEALLTFNLEPEEQVQCYHALVGLNVDIQNYETALEYAKKWGKIKPDDPDVRDMIGKLHLQTGGEDEALAEMEKVLEINPEDYATLEKVAGMYQRKGDDDSAFNAYEKLYQNDNTSVFFLEKTIEVGKKVGKPKRWIIDRLELLYKSQPDNLGVIEELADLTGSLKWVNIGLKQDPQNGIYPYMKGNHYHKRWENAGAKQDSINALTWYKRALKDPQWKNNANAQILTLDPPLTEEEKKRREFFGGSKQKKEEVKTEGKR